MSKIFCLPPWRDRFSRTTYITSPASHLQEVSSMATKKKSSGRKYSPKASKSVEREMHAMKKGKLKSGRSKKKVTSRKQAIAIGLSEARKSGAKVPNPPKKKSAKKKSTKKSSSKKSSKKAA
jgi:Family of unknown function (DUF6496)